uniref:Paralemmin-1 n=1 Tax=Mola mola TaxID=94237 RepID=A0A3Q3WN70_MOLML
VGEAHCQQDRLQLLSEKRKWQTEMENKRRQLEDDRRALQHLKSKALRERWLLDGAPSAGPEQDDVKTQLERDEARTRSLEETISRSAGELFGVTSIPLFELLILCVPNGPVQEGAGPQPLQTVTTEMTGLEAKAGVEPSVAEASAEKPITMVFMGYQSVEDEDETKRVLGLQGTVKAELVLLDDTDTKTSPAEGTEGAPPSCYRPPEAAAASNGGAAAEAKELKGGAVEVKKEKQPCKCCSIM